MCISGEMIKLFKAVMALEYMSVLLLSVPGYLGHW